MKATETYRDLPCYCITSAERFPFTAKGDALRVAYTAVPKGDM